MVILNVVWLLLAFLLNLAEKKTAIGIIEGNLDEASELVNEH